MSTLKLYLLGSPRVEYDSRTVEIPRHKALALLAYLAITQESHTRDTLAAMLWPEADASHARGALRRALSDIGRTCKSILVTSGDSIGLKPASLKREEFTLWVDAHSFHALVNASVSHAHPLDMPCPECLARLTEAAALYRDDFMQGFTLPDCPQFDEWQFFQTESYRQEMAVVLERLAGHYRAIGDIDEALLFARRWSALDPLQESAQRAVIELYAESGQRSAALRQYREYVRILGEEMNAAPTQALMILADRVRRAEIVPANRRSTLQMAGSAASAGRQDEIRYVTVLYAGFDHDDGQSPDGLADDAEELKRVVDDAAAQYGGHVGPFLAQGIQVLFGFPQMHEDDAERALRAALAIKDAARQHELRVSLGVSTGRMYVGPETAEGSQVVTVGPVVGLATRLQTRAAADHILVGESTYRATRGAFRFSPVLVDIASAGAPVNAFELASVLPQPTKARGIEGMRAELVGRDLDLTACTASINALLEGRGGVLSIVGEAGIGKSRLVEELALLFTKERERGDLLWVNGRCSEFSSAVPYSLFLDLIGTLMDITARRDQTRLDALSKVLNDLVRFGTLDSERRTEIEACIGQLLARRSSKERGETEETQPELVRNLTFSAVRDFLVAQAHVQPLVLVFEDLHWADAISLDLLAYLVEAIQSAPILLMCILRPDQNPKVRRLETIAAAKIPGRYALVSLRDLTPEQGRRMVCSMLRTKQLPSEIDNLLLQVWGNPFFIEETIRAMIESGALYRSGDAWISRETLSLPLPESIQSVILSRVDRLAPEVKRVLLAAAVIGRLFEPEVLEEAVPQGIDVGRSLGRLEEISLIYQDRVLPNVVYSFRHVLTQETVYQSLSRQQREELHMMVGAAVERLYPSRLEAHYEELAYHYSRSRDVDKAIEYLVKAGDKSRQAALNQAAIKYFDDALELAEKGQTRAPAIPNRIKALVGLGRIYHLIGKVQEAEVCLRQAIELEQRSGLDPRTVARTNYWLGQVLHWQGRYGEQMWLGESGLTMLSGRHERSVEAAMMNHMIASGSIQRGDHDRFHALADDNAELLAKLPYAEELPPLYEHILNSLADRRRVSEAQSWLDILNRMSEHHRDRHARAIACEFAARQSLVQGRLTDAEEHLAHALDIYRSTGDSINNWRCLDGSAWIAILQGKLTAAREKAWQALGIADKRAFNRIISESHQSLAVVSFAERDWELAATHFTRAIEFAQGSDPFWTEWAGLFGLGQIALAKGDTAQARHYFGQALAHFSPQLTPLGWEQRRWWSLSACILTGLEAACPDPDAFHALCTDLEEFKLQHAMPPIPMQWYFEPAMPDNRFTTFVSGFMDNRVRGDHDQHAVIAALFWLDPFGDDSYHVADGIEINAANGRDLWYMNTSAPQLVQSMTGSFAVEAVCTRAHLDRPAMGGLMIRRDDTNFVRLVWGTRGVRDVTFEGRIDETDLIVGRGLLPVNNNGKVWLRLERARDKMRALASSDGTQWYHVGQIDFTMNDPVEVGIHAVGWIDRMIYPGEYGSGTAIRFESFQVRKE